MPKDETGNAAFTLVEVMVSVVLMLLALGLLLSAFVSSKRSASLAQTHLMALQLVRSEAERLQTNAYSNIVSSSSILTNQFIEYRISNSVTTNNFGVTNILDISKSINIAVRWAAPVSRRPQALTNYLTICNPN